MRLNLGEKLLRWCVVMAVLALCGCSASKIQATVQQNMPVIQKDSQTAATVGAALNSILQTVAPDSKVATDSQLAVQIITAANGLIQQIKIKPVAQTPPATSAQVEAATLQHYGQ